MLRKTLGETVWAAQAEKAKSFMAEKLAALAGQKLNTRGLLGVGRKR